MTRFDRFGDQWAADRQEQRSRSRGAPNSPARIVEALEPRTLLSGFRASYEVVNDWGNGLQAEVRIENTSGEPIEGWTLSFDYEGTIDSLWNGTLAKKSGTTYEVSNPNWSGLIPPGAVVSFGFIARPGGASEPSNYRLNGDPMGGDPAPVLPTIEVGDIVVGEGDGEARFLVTLDRPSSETVRVDYGTVDGSAIAGQDYVPSTGSIQFAPGETSRTIAFPLLDDSLFEPEESFRLVLSSPVGAVIGRAEAIATIVDDDEIAPPPPPPNDGELAISYQVTQDWGSGFQGELTLTNNGSSPVSDWSFSFSFRGVLHSLWDGRIVSQEGERYTVTHAGWNESIAPGEQARIGFTASPGGGAVAPFGFSIDGEGDGGPPGESNRAPVATDDAVVVASGRTVRLDVRGNDSDPDGDPLSVVSVGTPNHGAVVINPDGTLSYTAWEEYVGTDAFSYVLSDGRGGEAEGMVSVSVVEPPPIQSEGRIMSPYVDMTLWPTYDLVTAAQEHGLRHFALSFVVADPQGKPSWGGYSEYSIDGSPFDLGLRDQIAGIRALGGDVMVSFGGASNQELAEVITDVNQLKEAYRSVVDAYGLTAIDMDIEGAALADRASVDRRSDALAALQQELAGEGRRLDIWVTLPVLPSGLTPDGLYLVQSALDRGVDLAGVNLMTMNYGSSAAPNPDGQTGDYAIIAAQSLHSQLRDLTGPTPTDEELWSKIGLTPMIGRNDVVTEVLDQQEAREIVAFAREVGIARLSFWSLHRDRENPNGAISYVEPTSSSIEQDPYEFTRIFLDFLA